MQAQEVIVEVGKSVEAPIFLQSSEPIIEEPAIEPLPLQQEMAVSAVALRESSEALCERGAKEEADAQDIYEIKGEEEQDLFEKNNTFNCAIDSKDLDIPTFMRQRND